jgi:hypothetical protein
MPLKPEYTEIALTLLSLGVLFSYHLQLYRQVRNNPCIFIFRGRTSFYHLTTGVL